MTGFASGSMGGSGGFSQVREQRQGSVNDSLQADGGSRLMGLREDEELIRRNRVSPSTGRGVTGGLVSEELLAQGFGVTPLASGFRQRQQRAAGGSTGGGTRRSSSRTGSVSAGAFPSAVT